MKAIYEKTVGMTDAELSYCPGCGHGIAHKLIMGVLEAKGLLDSAIGVSPIELLQKLLELVKMQ